MTRILTHTLFFGLVLLTLGWVRSASAYDFLHSYLAKDHKVIWNLQQRKSASGVPVSYNSIGGSFPEAEKLFHVGNPRLPWSYRYKAHSALVRATCAAVFNPSSQANIVYDLVYNKEGRGSETRSNKEGHHLVALIYETPLNSKDSLVTQTYQSILFNVLTSGVYDDKSYVALIYPVLDNKKSYFGRTSPSKVMYIKADELCFMLSGGIPGQGFIKNYLDYSAPSMDKMEEIIESYPPHTILNYGLEEILLDTLKAEAYTTVKKMRHRIIEKSKLLIGIPDRKPAFSTPIRKPRKQVLAFATGTVDLLVVADSYTATLKAKNNPKDNMHNHVFHYCDGSVSGSIINPGDSLSKFDGSPLKRYFARKHSSGGCTVPSDARSYTATLLDILAPKKSLLIDYFSPDKSELKEGSESISNTYFKDFFGCYDMYPNNFVPDMQDQSMFTDCDYQNLKKNPYPYCTSVKGYYGVREIGAFSHDFEGPTDMMIIQISEMGFNPFKLPKSFKRFISEFLNTVEINGIKTYLDQFAGLCITGANDGVILGLPFTQDDVKWDKDYDFNDGLYIWNSGIRQATALPVDKSKVSVPVSIIDGLTHETALSPVVIERPPVDNSPEVLTANSLIATSPPVPYSRANAKLYAYMNRYQKLGGGPKCADNPAEILLTDTIISLPSRTKKNPLDIIISYYFKDIIRADVLLTGSLNIHSSNILKDIDIPRKVLCDLYDEPTQRRAGKVLWGGATQSILAKGPCRKPLQPGPYFITSEMLADANVFPVSIN